MGPGFDNHLMGLVSELVLARSLRDVRTAFEIATGDAQGPEPDPARTPAPNRPRLALALSERHGPIERAAAQAAADAFAAAGVEIREAPPLDALGAEAGKVARTVLSVSLAEWLDGAGIAEAEVSPAIAAAAAVGRATTGPALFAAARDIARLSHRTAALFEGVDAILTPVLAGPPPPLGHFDPREDTDTRFAKIAAMAPNAALANVAGLPALAFPWGLAGGLPVGLQLLGRMGADAALMDIAGRVVPPPLPYPAPIAGMPE